MKPQLLNLILFVLTFISVATNTLYAQDFIEPCASDHLHNERLYSDPVYERSFFYLNQKIRDYAHGDIERSEEVFTLPIVVHIIHEGEPIGSGSNISDAQIQSAINDLNDAFRKTPGSPGDGNGADVEIEFCMASRDPDGNPTTGIIRIDGSVITDYADEGIEASGSAGADEEEVKALSTWPREDYVNIWIVNEIGDNDASGGTQGYAYFPIDDPVDGIVILHNAFGLVGNLKPNTDENKTLTHEMGHYFALHHTFYSTSSCEEEINCAEQGDHICDTPVTTLNANCNSPACSNQQVENYMDYTSENCRNMFTEDQKTRMRATLETERGSLLSSLGCIPVSELDCGISSIASPNGMICSNSFSPVVTITNYGSDVLNSVEINYGVDGNLNTSYDWSGTLEQGQSIEINLPSTSAGTGAHTFGAETNTPNATEDENDNNDLNEVDFSVSSGEPLLLQVPVDFFGDETTWEIVDIEGETVALGGPYTNNNQGNVFEENICAPTGCYDLIVFDDFGDGMSFTNGTYTLLDSDGSELVSGGGDFGDFEITNFCYTQTEAEGSAPIADFTFSDNTICAGANIDFVDLSSEFPTEWAWTFEGGSISNSTSENPQNIYFNSPGVFEVSLTASNEYGNSSHSVNVTVSENPTINLIGNSPTCYGLNNGSITTAIDYDGSYTFDWSNGSTNEDLNGLLGGTYTLTVETSNFCVDEETITLTNPMPMSIDLTIAHASCFELADGWIQSTINNGVGDITYDWSNGSSQANINDIPAGNYTLEITDENNCTVQESGTVNEPSPI